MNETPGAKIRENFGKSKRPRQGPAPGGPYYQRAKLPRCTKLKYLAEIFVER